MRQSYWFTLFFLTPLRWVTLSFMLTVSMIAIQAVMGWTPHSKVASEAARSPS